MMIFAVTVLLYAIINKVKPQYQLIHFTFFGLFLLMMLSWFWSIDKPLTLIGLQRNLPYFFIPFLFGFLPAFNRKSIHFILKYFSTVMVLFAVYVLVIAFVKALQDTDWQLMTHQNLANILNINRVMLAVFMSTSFLFWLTTIQNGILKYFSLSVLGIVIVLLSSKMVIIVMLLIVLSYFIQNISNVKKYTFFLIVISIPLVLFLSIKINNKFVSETIPRFQEILKENDFGYGNYFNGAELRILYTRFLWEINKEEPVFFTGFGLNASQSKLQEKIGQYNIYPDYVSFNFHNQFNQNMAELGIFGVLFLIIILLIGIKNGIKNETSFWVFFVILFAFYMFTDTPMSSMRTIYLFLILFFIFNQKTILINKH